MRAFLERFDIRVSAAYATIVMLWVLLSDALASVPSAENPAALSLHRLVSGLIFVVLSTPAIFAILFAEQRKRARLEQALQHDIIMRTQAEEAIRASEERYRMINDASQDLIHSYDHRGRFTFANRRFCETLGLSLDQIVGKSYAELGFPEAQWHEWDELHRRVYANDATVTAQTSTVLGDGQQHHFELILSPLHDHDGAIIGVSATTRDITERAKAEAERRRSDERYHILFQHMLNGFAYHRMIYENGTPVDYIFLDVNSAFEAMTGLRDVIGRRVTEVIPGIGESDPALIETYGRVAQTGQAETFERYVESLQMWVAVSVYSPERGYFVTVFDVITERKAAEKRIQRLNRTLAVLSDVNQSIVRIHSLPTLYETVCQIAVNKGGFRMAWVGLYDVASGRVEPVASAGVVGDYLKEVNVVVHDAVRGSGPTGTAVRTGQHVVIADVEHDPRMGAWRDRALALGYRATGAFPLIVGGETRGMLGLYSGEPDFFDEEELRLLDEMAGDLSFAMEFAEQDARRQQMEAALRTSEEQYRSLVESSDAAICTFDRDGVLRYANQITANTLRQPLADIVGKPMAELFAPSLAQAQLAAVQLVIQTGQGTVNESFSTVLGAPRWYRNSIQPVRDALGQVSAVLINAADITAFKQAEVELQKAHDTLELKVVERTAELQAAKEQVEAILDNSLDGILLVAADLSIRQTNTAFHKLFACENIGCAGLSLLDFIAAADASRVQAAVAASIREQVGTHVEVTARRDSLQFDAELSIGSISADSLVCTLRDITERKKSEQALRASEERFRQIAENIDHILFIRSSNERDILYINRAYETFSGRTREDLYAQPSRFMESVHPDDRIFVRQQLALPASAEQQLDDYAFRMLAADEQIHWMRMRIFPIHGDDGTIARRVGIIEDITRHKQYEEALEGALRHERELGELKSRFVSMASHEFRTPLASILSSTELLLHFRQKMDDEKIRQKLMAIVAQVQYLTNVIEDVLQLTRIQSQHIDYNPVTLDPDALCREIVDEFRVRPEVGQRLIYHAQAVPTLELDNRLMRQIISNLISNAIKYSPKGTTVEVNLEYSEKTLIMTVSDEGIGIPENDLKHLFEPFHRAANVGTISGTGLGLSITKESVEQHGGTITVESEVNVGTVFTVRIPGTPASASSG